MTDQIARTLRQAMAGPGTDESAIYAALAGRNQAQVDEIGAAYLRLFGRDLGHDLQDELNESELRQLAVYGAMAQQTTEVGDMSRSLAEVVARQLDAAMDRVGTDESAIYAALTGRTDAERELIRSEYLRLTGRELIADLRSELSGAEMTRAEMLFTQGVLLPEDELFLAMAGLGTDEDTILRVVDAIGSDPAQIRLVEARFRTKYGDMVAELRGDLSTAEYERVIGVLGPVIGDVAFEDCNATVRREVRGFLPDARAKVERAIRVLEQGWAGMSATEKATFNRFFDPGATGEIDDSFVETVLHNFRLIRLQLGHELTVECEGPGGICEGARLYYTYGSNVHVCPYFVTAPATENTRKARDFVHELAHNAMAAFDRPYFDAATNRYERPVSPQGPWGTGIPVIGALIRVIARSDTLYHPDAYSWFAFTV